MIVRQILCYVKADQVDCSCGSMDARSSFVLRCSWGSSMIFGRCNFTQAEENVDLEISKQDFIPEFNETFIK